MASTVRSRPSLYELLGLTPAASSGEIERAFAREIGMFRPLALGGVAQLSIAYETLKDPARRRAYDASIGLAPEPKPAPQPAPAAGWYGAAVAATGFVTARRIGAPDVKPEPRPEPRPELLAEPTFIAAPPRAPEHPAPQARPRLEPHVIRAAARSAAVDSEDRPIAWQRPAMIVGGLIGAVGLIGALAGVQAGNDVEAAQTLALPPAKVATARPAIAAPAPAPALSLAEARPERAARPAKRRPPLEVNFAEAAKPEAAPAAQNAFVEKATEQAVAEAPAAETAVAPAVAANMPLPNRTIARTIERIGYACGSVASATESGAPGVFTVTCTSGQSYQARPVNGRYRFKRLGRQ